MTATAPRRVRAHGPAIATANRDSDATRLSAPTSGTATATTQQADRTSSSPASTASPHHPAVSLARFSRAGVWVRAHATPVTRPHDESPEPGPGSDLATTDTEQCPRDARTCSQVASSTVGEEWGVRATRGSNLRRARRVKTGDDTISSGVHRAGPKRAGGFHPSSSVTYSTDVSGTYPTDSTRKQSTPTYPSKPSSNRNVPFRWTTSPSTSMNDSSDMSTIMSTWVALWLASLPSPTFAS